MKMWGAFCLMQIIMLLTMSFFVFFAASKTASKSLKIFGNAIAVILLIITGVLFVLSIYLSLTKSRICPLDYPWRSNWGYQQKIK